MKNKKLDIRDEILEHLKKIERNLSWLATKSGINYSTLYSILRQRTFNFSDENLKKINSILETNFKN